MLTARTMRRLATDSPLEEKTELDILSHALWTTAAGLGARKKLKRPIHLGWVALWGVLPDLVVFTVPAVVRIWRFLTGASTSLLPDGNGPHFDWVWGLYNGTHSALVFAVCFGAAWLFLRKPPLEMLGWALHILIDVFTHRGIFAVKFLWPVSSVHFDGIRWETPSFLAANFAALASVYLLVWIYRVRKSSSMLKTEGNTAGVRHE
ncbi:MAG TPA: hypothetical protein VGF61_01810 [Candidatus Acidoferrum sp.]